MKEEKTGKKVLLLHAPFNKQAFGKGWVEKKSLAPPLGLLYLGSPLLRKGYNVSFMDLNVDHLTGEEFLAAVEKQDFILITCFDGTVKNVRQIIQVISRINERAVILCGGPYCNNTREFIEGSTITCAGEFENDIVDLLERITLKKSLNGISGLIYTKDGKLVENPGFPVVENLDSSMIPARELAAGKKYGSIGITRLNIALTMTSRGCPFTCSFCSTGSRIRYRERSIDSVVNEIKNLVRQGYRYITFGDDNFLCHEERVMKMMDRIIEENIKVRLIILGRVDSADRDLYMKLREAGVMAILFGIESASQDMLNFYNKRTTVEKGIEAINLANEAGIVTFGSFIIGAPFETREHFEKTREYFDEVPLDLMICNKLVYTKGSKLWDHAREAGLIKASEGTVTTGKRLSNYSTGEWSAIKNDLTGYFYRDPRRLLRLSYKLVRLGETRLVVKALLDINSLRNRLKATLFD
ncbi:MAG: B12-binding domain-containing radical SAM protein [Candidatus Odinarchaeota archaeon]